MGLYVINTYAGDGTAGYSGDTGLATSAQLYGPRGVCVDSSGNVYIADTTYSVIRKVDTGGIISTIAGTGTAGYNGEGTATSVRLNGPFGLAIDSSGNLYIADTGNHRIRKVTPGGIISTIAGTGTAGYNGEGTATSARLNTPRDVFIDSSGILYIADSLNNRIRKVTTGGIISTIAGTGISGYDGEGIATSVQLNFPSGITMNSSGDLYIADSSNNRIRKVTPGGIISTYAGTDFSGYDGEGTAIGKKLNFPGDVCVDSSGNLYIADISNNRIRKVTTGGIISTYAGTDTAGYNGEGTAIDKQLFAPSGVAIDSSGILYIADSLNNRIRNVSYVICFNEGSKIMCLINNTETYVPIENITKGMLVKTALNGYLPVYKTGTNVVRNNTDDPIMYKCTKRHELFEDLILTKNHSILVDSLTDKQKEDTIKDFGQLCVTGNKYRLMCKFDDNFKGCVDDKNFNIWHISLENDNRYTNYGIYANGLLVESCSKRCIDDFMKS